MKTSDQPLLSVCMITYNHEAFIAQAIEGVLAQKTTFPIELVIGEDHSTDNTWTICARYAAQYPTIIRLLSSEANLGAVKNNFKTLSNCKGKYVAICEGDDFWVDPLKLQKQVDFLEKNEDYGLVYTDIQVVSAEGKPFTFEPMEKIKKEYRSGNVFFKLFVDNFIPTCTVVFRSKLLQFLQSLDQDKYWYILDHYLWLRVAGCSNVHFINDVTAHYRVHANGLTSVLPSKIKKIINHLSLYDNVLYLDRQKTIALNQNEKTYVFQKILSLLYRKEGNLTMRLQALRLLPKYFPGVRNSLRIIKAKVHAS